MSDATKNNHTDSGIEWIGSLPESWSVKPMFAVVEEIADKNVGGRVQNVLSLSYGKIIRRDVNTNFGLLPESFDTYQVVQRGDIVLRLLDLQNDQISLRVGLVPEEGIVTSAYVSVRPKEGLVPEYAAYLLHAYDVKKVFYSFGGGCRQSMGFEDLRRLPIPFPSQDEQRRIVAYLDEQTAKIDRLVEMRRRQMALLKEQRAALIQRAVTRGVNPAAPLKDSGLPWLSEIPAHWEVKPLKWCIQFGSSISYGIVQPGDQVDDGIPFIQTTDISKDSLDVSKLQRTSADIAAAYPRSRLSAGDVILGIRASIGKAHTVGPEFEGVNLSRGIARIAPNSKLILSKFLVLYLRTNAVMDAWNIVSQGSTFSEVSIANTRELPVILPQIEEQQKILKFVETEAEKFDNLNVAYARQLALLAEYRAALIHECVTGRRRVTPAASLSAESA